MFSRILVIVVGGALGALARWGMAEAINRVAGQATPVATAAANLLGCFLFGVVWVLAEDANPLFKLLLLTGFMGSFTTFSTFVFDSGHLLQQGEWAFAALNLAGQVMAGLLCLFVGFALGRSLSLY